MKSLSPFFLAAIILHSFSGCGKFDRLDDGGTTTVEFKAKGKSAQSAIINGGIVVYANSENYSTNLKIADESSPAAITLPNGVYTFYALAYRNVNGPTSSLGDANCAVSAPTPLSGSAITIPLELTRNKCADGSFFSPAGGVASTSSVYYFKGVQVIPCASTVDITSKVYGTNCGFGDEWTAVNGAQMVLPIYKAGGTNTYNKLGEAYRSACSTSGLNDGFGSYPTFFVPWSKVGASQRLPVEIEFFADTSCSTPLHKFVFDRGLANQSKVGVSNPTTDGNNIGLYLKQP